jgi:hypothetical protein
MVTLPVREDAVVFCVIERLTVPLPVPLAPVVTVIQDALEVAVQEHPEPELTLTLAVPPALPVEVLLAFRE